MHLDKRFLNLHDFEPAARSQLPRGLFGFVRGGSADGWSVANNRTAFDRWAFVPRTLNAGPARRQEVRLFGQSFASPIGIAPMGVSALFRFDADVAMARAAAAARVPYVLSGASLTPMERVFEANREAWFQAYVDADAARTGRLLARLRKTPCRVLVLAVDTPVPPSRELSLRHGFSIPVRPSVKLVFDTLLHPRWLLGTAARTVITRGVPWMENFDDHPLNRVTEAPPTPPGAPLGWDDFRWIRREWPHVLVVKGVVSAEDAARYRNLGADGLIVSNHGGRQLDGTVAPLDALPAIADRARGMPLLLDGGIRRGTDVVKALALGAASTFVGRPILYAAAAAGEPGIARALAILQAEIDRTQALLGVPVVTDVGPNFLIPAPPSAIPAPPSVIPAPASVIPAPPSVIPAQAGIQEPRP